MKFLVPNYSCLQNPRLGGCCSQIPFLCPQLNLLNPPRTKFLGTPLNPLNPQPVNTMQNSKILSRCLSN